jgi:uncharacterized damage-inducible protein DinB
MELNRREFIAAGGALVGASLVPTSLAQTKESESMPNLKQPIELNNRGDIGECGFIRSTLDYNVHYIVACFETIPEEALYKRIHPNLHPAAWIFGHIMLKERDHIGGFAQNIWDLPKQYSILRNDADVPPEAALKTAVGTKDEIITQWGKVRQQTWDYLDSLSDKDLAVIPDHMKDKQHADPIREFFAMTIHHQNYHWGQLTQISRMSTHTKSGGCG